MGNRTATFKKVPIVVPDIHVIHRLVTAFFAFPTRPRSAWLDAIGAAYHRLELVLLDRAFNGTEKVVQRRDGSEERMREYSNQLGLALLKMHRDKAIQSSAEPAAEDVEEARRRLAKKLLRLKERIVAGGAPG